MQGVEFSQPNQNCVVRCKRKQGEPKFTLCTVWLSNILKWIYGPAEPQDATADWPHAHRLLEPPWRGLSWRVLGRQERGAEVEGGDLA